LLNEGVWERTWPNFVSFVGDIDPVLVEHSGVRIFNSRLVNEVKGKATNTSFEKSKLVIQAYNDEGKELILNNPKS
jgi:hypothetical protein